MEKGNVKKNHDKGHQKETENRPFKPIVNKKQHGNEDASNSENSAGKAAEKLVKGISYLPPKDENHL